MMAVPNRLGSVDVYFIETDHLDTPRVVLDSNGNVRWRWLADPFGVGAPEVNPSGLGPVELNLRMPGQYADAESRLFYNMARFYEPARGRFVQADPTGLEGGTNPYTYSNGNPVTFVDPDGQLAFVPFLPIAVD